MTRREKREWQAYFRSELAEFLRGLEYNAEITTAAIQLQPDATEIWAIRDAMVASLEAHAGPAPERFLEAFHRAVV